MYFALDEKTAVDYVRSFPGLMEILGGSDDLKCVDLAEGNINLIFRVQSGRDPVNHSLLIKQALPHSRRYPDFKIPLDRARIEYELLNIEAKYCPEMVPRLYRYDAEMNLNVMEDLNRHVVLRYGLMKQIRYPFLAKHIGTFLARTLFYTSDLYLSSSEKKALVPKFINPVLCKISEDLVFTEPFIDHPNNRWTRLLDPQVSAIRSNDQIRSEALRLKLEVMCSAQALIHGDLHTGSIMANENETKVIDPEFAYFGPMGYDIGAVLGNLALSYASQEHHAHDPQVRSAYQRWLLDTFREVWTIFESEFRRIWETDGNNQWPSAALRDKYLVRLLQDTAGFGACKMMRRILGLAHVPDLDNIEDDHARAKAESLALNIASAWLMGRQQMASVDDLISAILASKPSFPFT